MHLLEVQNLSVSFSTYLGRVHSVKNLSFSIQKGEIIAIVGESGCGKSVTAQAIMGLIPKPTGRIESGAILFEKRELMGLSQKKMAKIRGKEIGMIFQDPMTSLNPTMSIGRQIIEGLIKHKKSSLFEAEKISIETLHMVGISDPTKRMRQFPHELSGGMRQRVMIAIALACFPKLLIADEPTTALDVTIQAQILSLMKEAQEKMGMSIILITHDLAIVASMCDRVIVMYCGEVIESGNVDQIFSKPSHPYTQGLLRSIPRLDLSKEQKLIPISGSPPNLLKSPQGCAFTPRCPYAMRICKEQKPISEIIDEGHHVCCWLEKRDTCRH